MIRFFDKATPSGKGKDGLQSYEMRPYFEAYKSASTRIVRPARSGDKVAHPNEWKAYLAAREPDHDGFPLAAWPQINEAERLGLNERGIHTLEKLVETDMDAAPIELREAQDKARDFLSQTNAEAPQLAGRIADLEQEKAGLIEQGNDQRAEIDRLKEELRKAREAREATKPGTDGNKKTDETGMKAEHRGGGRFNVTSGETTLLSGLSKADADKFNAMSDEDKAKFVEAEKAKS